jgi:hypothetical protein
LGTSIFSGYPGFVRLCLVEFIKWHNRQLNKQCDADHNICYNNGIRNDLFDLSLERELRVHLLLIRQEIQIIRLLIAQHASLDKRSLRQCKLRGKQLLLAD